MIDDRTTYLRLPLPHEKNELSEDLPRLRESFTALDAHAKAEASIREEGDILLAQQLARSEERTARTLAESEGRAAQALAESEGRTAQALENAVEYTESAYAKATAAIIVSAPLVGGGALTGDIPLGLAAASEGDILAFKDGAWTFSKMYELCEFYYFRHPTLKPGFQPAQGGLLADAATLYPEAWEYLQSVEGQKLCKTETEWQALTTATWATLADGSKVGWNGIGGAPFYAMHLDTGALRLPDLRGMYAEAAGFDSLGVGGVHGDGMRNVTGGFSGGVNYGGAGPFYYSGLLTNAGNSGSIGPVNYRWYFDLSRSTPVANKFQPRAWGALACVYLGTPR